MRLGTGRATKVRPYFILRWEQQAVAAPLSDPFLRGGPLAGTILEPGLADGGVVRGVGAPETGFRRPTGCSEACVQGPQRDTVRRVGIGTDLHRLVPGRRMVLGGVTIPAEVGPLGHSDGDVVLHAVIDAIAGAAGLPDIGEMFPDSDPAYKDADSGRLLVEAVRRMGAAGRAIVNVDVIIHLERPRLSAHKPAIRRSLADLLGVDADAVSVKAKSSEGVDAVGRGEAVACTAVVGLH